MPANSLRCLPPYSVLGIQFSVDIATIPAILANADF
jgi:hypothetical protein